MVVGGRQFLGLFLAAIGFLGTIIICILPEWRVTGFIGTNIVTSQILSEGLLMSCVTQSTGQIQCKVYDSFQASRHDLQAARVLIVIAIIVGVFGILLGVVGGMCTKLMPEKRQKSKVTVVSGVVFIIVGVLVFIPVCWTAKTIISDFYNPVLTNVQTTNLGASLYIGWASAGLLFLGGGCLCCSCPPKDETDYDVRYSKDRSVKGRHIRRSTGKRIKVE